MASSKLLKEAIADAKAVRETAIANAKIALEEAFTPRLQSILSRKLQAEIEDNDDEDLDDVNEENDASSEIGKGDNKTPAIKANSAQTDLSGISKTGDAQGSELDDYDKVKDLTEGDDDFGDDDTDLDTDDDTDLDTDGDDTDWDADDTDDDQDEDDLDLESIIRELEDGMDDDTDGYSDDTEVDEADENEDGVTDDVTGATNPYTEGDDTDFDTDGDTEGEDDDIDLDEILREMGYGDDEDGEEAPVEDDDTAEELAATQNELKEAMKTINSLRKTINEVNLLNAKLLFANKLFRGYNLTNEQKVKVVENLDRTSSVREVKLVYSTLCESMKFSGTQKKQSVKRTISEGLASKPQKSTAPKKEILSEGDMMAKRFQELAGITSK